MGMVSLTNGFPCLQVSTRISQCFLFFFLKRNWFLYRLTVGNRQSTSLVQYLTSMTMSKSWCFYAGFDWSKLRRSSIYIDVLSYVYGCNMPRKCCWVILEQCLRVNSWISSLTGVHYIASIIKVGIKASLTSCDLFGLPNYRHYTSIRLL